MTLLGAPFRLHGRSIETGLDCVGVVHCCIAETGREYQAPEIYGLRGAYENRALAFFVDAGFENVHDASWVAGDILLFRPGPRQIHLAVLSQRGAVHAHMGLRRVVLTPFPMPYTQIGQWRFQGD